MADKESELKAQEALLQKSIEEQGKSLVAEEIARLNRENEATEKVLAGKQRILDDKIKKAESEWEEAKQATKDREEALFPPLIRRMVLLFAVLVVLFGYFAWWGYKVRVADKYSETIIGQKQITVKHLFRKDEVKTVNDTQKYIKPLIQGVYDLKKKKKNTTVNHRVLKSISEFWVDLEFHPKEEEQKDKSDQTQAIKQGKKEQPKKSKPKPAQKKAPKPKQEQTQGEADEIPSEIIEDEQPQQTDEVIYQQEGTPYY